MTLLLAFRRGPSEVAFDVALAAWLLFEFAMRVRQQLRATGPLCTGSSIGIQCGGAGSAPGTGARK